MSQATLSSTVYRNSDLFSGYFLDERVGDLDGWDCDTEAEAAFAALQDLWEAEGELVASYNEDELLDAWIDEVLGILGFDTMSETTLPSGGGYNDRLLFDSTENRRNAARQKRDGNPAGMYNQSAALLEAKQWDTDFTERFAEGRQYRDASHQVKYYLEHTPEAVEWGILTDGKKWRLYGTKDYATETYYEVDLPELLVQGDLAAFKYFYAFFRPAAFRETRGTSFLETVWSESETAAQELGEDLQDNVFTALRVLGEGFVESNDLGIDPADAAAREELKEQSLVLLYRLMFVFYAESRTLIHPDDPEAETDYHENFSVEALRDDVVERIESGETFDDFSEYSTQMWGRLQDLFRLIDTGEEALGIPAYNGGLFDDDDHAFLAEHDVADRYVAEVVYRLGTTENDADEDVLADYADLDTRHLGTIYEGLLEHEFRIAPEEYAAVAEDGGQVWKPATEVTVAEAVETVAPGELYVVNDDGERKATGAYYTPDYVVSYIVEETVDPLLDEIHAELEADGLSKSDEAYFGRFYGAIQDLTILDPAMGSGHFLTTATGYLTEQVMEVVREQERMGRDEQQLRRTISRECIYGVDINGMATELAKLSMWLETLATDQPLAFLDHHLKAGNSLVGSDITEVLATSEPSGTEQATLFDDFSRTRRQALEHVMGLLEDLLDIENETVADAKAMERLYDEIRSDVLYERLFAIANVHTAERFGLDVPAGEDVYKTLADAIDDDDAWGEVSGRDWFRTAQAMADEEQFFHWELEYPEVFFGEGGERSADAGFDAVVGNPPYIKIQNLPESPQSYYRTTYASARERFDIYNLFVERGHRLSRDQFGYIIPNKFFESNGGEPLREFISEQGALRKLVDFGRMQVFKGVSTYTSLLFLSGDDSVVAEYGLVEEEPRDIQHGVQFREVSVPGGSRWNFISPEEAEAISKVETRGEPLGEVANQIFVGIQTSADKVFVLQDCSEHGESLAGYSRALDQRVTVDRDICKPYLSGNEIDRYTSPSTDQYLIYPYTPGGNLIPEETLRSEYTRTHEYLDRNREALSERGSENQVFESWYAHWCPRVSEKFEREKVIVPEIVKGGEAALDMTAEMFHSTTVYSPILDGEYLTNTEALAILNSKLIWFYITRTGTVLRGGYYRYKSDYLKSIGVPSEIPAEVSDHVDTIIDYSNIRGSLNLNLLDHLGTYDDGETLAEIGFTQPPENAADSILQLTADAKPNLRVGEAEVVRESPSTVEIRLTARYKPDDEDAHETDQWGYTETSLLPALRVTDLTETEADLIEAFVPVAVDEAGGFAGFRETATKTNSLVDRLRGLTLPVVDDVANGLEQYNETTARAEELDAKIQRTDDLIDEIVYELYGLTDEEIAIVEEAVGE